jgi:PadR family transcriptional regulator PadR
MQGTLDLLVLKALATAPMHGWAISARIRDMSKGAFAIGQGSLYPALHRLEKREWITSIWRQTENNRIARYYELTPRGRRELDAEVSKWKIYRDAMDLVVTSD